jgi:hypothetical protein
LRIYQSDGWYVPGLEDHLHEAGGLARQFNRGACVDVTMGMLLNRLEEIGRVIVRAGDEGRLDHASLREEVKDVRHRLGRRS